TLEKTQFHGGDRSNYTQCRRGVRAISSIVPEKSRLKTSTEKIARPQAAARTCCTKPGVTPSECRIREFARPLGIDPWAAPLSGGREPTVGWAWPSIRREFGKAR